MYAFIETLETRQMLSVSHPAVHAAPRSPAPIHMTPTADQTMVFQGKSLNSDGSFDADVQMTLVPVTGGTYGVRIVVLNSDGGVSNLTTTLDATGHFSFTQTDGGGSTAVQGQLSTDKRSFTATWSSTNSSGIRSGTASLTRSTLAVAKTAGMQFEGTGTGSDGGQGTMTAFVLQTNGGYWVALEATDPKGETGGILLNMNPGGKINYTGTDDSGDPITVHAQMSGRTLSGSWRTLNSDGSTGGATFSLTET